MDEWRPILPTSIESRLEADTGRWGCERSDGGVREIWQRLVDMGRWIGFGRIAAFLVGVPVFVVSGYLLIRTPSAPIESTLAYATPSSATEATVRASNATFGEPRLKVHVAGHVVSPGVYEVDAGARVIDVIGRAGGALPIADLDSINLAVSVHDGDQVYVPAVGEVVDTRVTGRVGSPEQNSSPSFPIDINVASVSDLDALPGVGPTTAAAIIAYREQHGPFASTSDLLNVPGIGAAKFDVLKNLVRT